MMRRQALGLSRSGALVAVMAVAIGGAGTGCSRTAPPALSFNFATAWTDGLLVTESAVLDIGTEEARDSLGDGWYYDERNRDSGETFAWSRGPTSEIFFHLGWRRDLRIEVECRPFEFDGSTPQILRFELNGHSIGEPLTLEKTSARYSIDLPESAQNVGRNRLLVRYARVDSPSSVTSGSTDERELGVAWSALRFEGVDGEPMRADEREVFMPAGCRADLFPDLRRGSLLSIESCESVGESTSILEISVLGEFDVESESFSADCDGGAFEIPLTNREGLTRIRFVTRPHDDLGTPTGIRLRRPRVLSPAAERTEDVPLVAENKRRSNGPT